MSSVYEKVGGRHVHRIVAEEKIGRSLLPGEVVHHIDGNSLNNDPDNLQVLASQAEHVRLHFTKNRKCGIPGCDAKHKCGGLCSKHYQEKRARGSGVPLKGERTLCSVEDCDRFVNARGLCTTHYQRKYMVRVNGKRVIRCTDSSES